MLRQRTLLSIVIVASVLLVSLGLIALLPEVVLVTPESSSAYQSPTTAFSITFSRLMRPESVAERLEIEPAMAGELSWTFTGHGTVSPSCPTIRTGSDCLAFPTGLPI